jgi:hypothetical protein
MFYGPRQPWSIPAKETGSTIDETGGLYIVWQKIDKNNTNPGEILIVHLFKDDIPHQGFEQDGKEYSVFETNGIFMIAAFSDNEGGAIVIAHTLAGLFKKNMIYVQHVSSEGVKLWEQRIIIDK